MGITLGNKKDWVNGPICPRASVPDFWAPGVPKIGLMPLLAKNSNFSTFYEWDDRNFGQEERLGEWPRSPTGLLPYYLGTQNAQIWANAFISQKFQFFHFL